MPPARLKTLAQDCWRKEKIERKGESQAKIGKIRLKIGKKGKIEKNIKVR